MMKRASIKAGMFVCCASNGWIREILHIGGASDPFAGDVVYADPFGGGRCSLSTMARWADREVARPSNWTRPASKWIELLGILGKLPEQDGKAPPMAFSKEKSDLAQAIVLHAFRNTVLEDIHAGRAVRSKTGDYADVKIVTPYGEIAWNEASLISDEQMRKLMIRAVNTVYTMLAFPHVQFRGPTGWNDAEPDEGMMLMLRSAGILGDAAKEEATAELRAKMEGAARDGGEPSELP
jgi:hypothetical protein